MSFPECMRTDSQLGNFAKRFWSVWKPAVTAANNDNLAKNRKIVAVHGFFNRIEILEADFQSRQWPTVLAPRVVLIRRALSQAMRGARIYNQGLNQDSNALLSDGALLLNGAMRFIERFDRMTDRRTSFKLCAEAD